MHWFVDVTQTLLASLNKSVSQSMGEAIKRKVNFEIKRAVIVKPCHVKTIGFGPRDSLSVSVSFVSISDFPGKQIH